MLLILILKNCKLPDSNIEFWDSKFEGLQLHLLQPTPPQIIDIWWLDVKVARVYQRPS